MDMFETASKVEALYNRSIDVVAKLRARGDVQVEGSSEPTRRSPRFSISRTAELVGRTSASIRDAEKEGRLPNCTADPIRSKGRLHACRSERHADGVWN